MQIKRALEREPEREDEYINGLTLPIKWEVYLRLRNGLK